MSLMDVNSQLDFANQMELHGEAEREFQIREAARQYIERATVDRWGAPEPFHFADHFSVGYVAQAAPIPIQTFQSYTIHVHPAIRGKERVIIAEAQLREQMEVPDL